MIWELNLTARCRFWTQSQLIRFQSAVSSEDEQAAWLPSKLLHRRKMKTNVDEKAFRGWILSTRLLLCHINAEMKKKKSKRNKECCEILNPHQNQIICSLACGWTVFILSVRKLEMKLRRRWKKKKKHSVFKPPKRQKCQKKKDQASQIKKNPNPTLFHMWQRVCKEAAYTVWSSVSFMTPAWTLLKRHDALLSSLIGSTSHHLRPLSSFFFFFFDRSNVAPGPRRPNRSDMCFWFENLQ